MTNYILEYYQKITEGEIIAGEKIKRWYRIVVRGIEEKRWYYDPKKAAAVLIFAERYCRHHEGELGGKLIKLELWQKAFLSVIFGVVDANGNRQFREVCLEVGRKNGKTLIAAIIAAYLSFAAGEYGARVYFCAPKLDQARLCFEAYHQIIKTEPTLDKMAQKRRTDIYIPSLNASAMPIPFSSKSSDGLNIYGAICDECAAWRGEPGRRFYEVIKSSCGARREPMIVIISTAGYSMEGSMFDEMLARCSRVLEGTSSETRLAPFLYTLDAESEWDDINALYKANPNLGVSISADYLIEEIAAARESLARKAEFLVKYCNLPQTASVAWMKAEWINKASGAPLNPEDHARAYCTAGIDLSRSVDLTSACVLLERDEEIYIFPKFFMPAGKLEEATARDHLPYAEYVRRGELILSGENDVDYHDVQNWINEMAEKYYLLPLVIGYDRYSANYLVKDLELDGWKCDSCFQGENMTPGINQLEGWMRAGKVHIGDNQLLRAHLASAGLKINNETERKRLIKIDVNEHIDGVAAILDAIIVLSLIHI